MRIIPVIDVMGGRVVRAVGGHRSEYRPIRSKLTDSTDPVEVARVLLDATGSDCLYAADIDAIQGNDSGPSTSKILGVSRLPLNWVWADLGFRCSDDLVFLFSNKVIRPVLASETTASPGLITEVAKCWKETTFSLDLRNSVPMGCFDRWRLREVSPAAVAERAVDAGARNLLLIDLAEVGSGRGPVRANLCQDIRRRLPGAAVYVGGGIRDWDDVKRLEDAGADGVLVASALHDGTLTFPRQAS